MSNNYLDNLTAQQERKVINCIKNENTQYEMTLKEKLGRIL